MPGRPRVTPRPSVKSARFSPPSGMLGQAGGQFGLGGGVERGLGPPRGGLGRGLRRRAAQRTLDDPELGDRARAQGQVDAGRGCRGPGAGPGSRPGRRRGSPGVAPSLRVLASGGPAWSAGSGDPGSRRRSRASAPRGPEDSGPELRPPGLQRAGCSARPSLRRAEVRGGLRPPPRQDGGGLLDGGQGAALAAWGARSNRPSPPGLPPEGVDRARKRHDPRRPPPRAAGLVRRQARASPGASGPSERRAGRAPRSLPGLAVRDHAAADHRAARHALFPEAFTRRWPTVEALAAAQDGELMSAWAGLGYYARARNLLACARAVANRPWRRLPRHRGGAARACPASAPIRRRRWRRSPSTGRPMWSTAMSSG